MVPDGTYRRLSSCGFVDPDVVFPFASTLLLLCIGSFSSRLEAATDRVDDDTYVAEFALLAALIASTSRCLFCDSVSSGSWGVECRSINSFTSCSGMSAATSGSSKQPLREIVSLNLYVSSKLTFSSTRSSFWATMTSTNERFSSVLYSNTYTLVPVNTHTENKLGLLRLCKPVTHFKELHERIHVHFDTELLGLYKYT